MTQFTKLSLAVEHDGKPYFVAIPEERWPLLLHMASGLTDNGQLNLVKAPAGFTFQSLNGSESNDPSKKQRDKLMAALERIVLAPSETLSDGKALIEMVRIAKTTIKEVKGDK